MLTKAQILAIDDRKFEDVDVPEWGGSVRIGSMSALARDGYDQLFTEIREKGLKVSIRAHLAAACIVDENGDQIFEPSDVEALGKKSAKALIRIFNRCAELNGLTEAAKEAKEGN